MRVKKRGLSDVVTTVLIILLVLAAIAIIWQPLRNTLIKSGGQITSSCLTLDLAPVSCSATATQATVRYGRNAGDSNLRAVSLVLTVNGNNVVTNATIVPKVLETFTQVVAVTAKPTSFTVAGYVTTESGEDKLCPMAPAITCT